MKHEKIFTENFLYLRDFPKKSQRKAQSLPMNTIVIAAIALLVLVILALIFTGRINVFSRGVAECSSQGGKCFSDSCGTETALNSPSEYPPASVACAKANENKPYCCLPIQS